MKPWQMMRGFGQPASGGGAISATWDAVQSTVSAVLSSGNLRITANASSTGSYANTRSTRALQGLAYISAQIGTSGSGAVYGFGLADMLWDATNPSLYCGGSGSTSIGMWGPNGSTYFNGSVIGSLGSASSPANVEIAVRVASRRIWIRRSGGTWLGGGDPQLDTSPTATLAGTSPIYACASVTRAGAISSWFVELRGDAGTTTGTPPTGFIPANWA